MKAPTRTVLAFLAAFLGTCLVQPWPVTALEPSQDPSGDPTAARVLLQDVAPASPRPGQAVVLSGKVRMLPGVASELGTDELLDPLLVLRTSGDPLELRADVARVAEEPLFRYGVAGFDITAAVKDPLRLGEAQDFRLRVPMKDLGLVAPGVYVIGVDLLATLPSGVRTFVGSARTTVPVIDKDQEPARLALMWPLSAAPSLLIGDELADDRLARALEEGRRLQRLVTAPGGSPVSWLIDPDLLATAQVMAAGYQVRLPPGPGTGTEDAQRFLTELGSAVGRGDVWRLPTADPDLAGLVAADTSPRAAGDLLEQALTSPEDPLLDLSPALVAPASGSLTPRVVRAIEQSGAPLVMGSADGVDPALPGVSGTLLSRSGAVAGDLVRTDPGLSSAVTAKSRDATRALSMRQRLLAEAAMLALAEDDPRAVIAPPLRWSPRTSITDEVLRTWQETPWIEPEPLTALRSGDESAAPTFSPIGGGPPPDRLDATVAATSKAVTLDAQRLSTLFPDPAGLAAGYLALGWRAGSTAWIDAPGAGRRFGAAADAVLAEQEARVRVVLPASITLSGRTGRLPLTVVNDLTEPVQVTVRLDSANADRLSIISTGPLNLDAGEKRTVTVRAEAAAGGRVPVQAQLVTASGVLIGSPVPTTVDVTDAGFIGWALVGSAGLLLLVAGVRFRAKSSRGHDADELAPVPTGSSRRASGD